MHVSSIHLQFAWSLHRWIAISSHAISFSLTESSSDEKEGENHGIFGICVQVPLYWEVWLSEKWVLNYQCSHQDLQTKGHINVFMPRPSLPCPLCPTSMPCATQLPRPLNCNIANASGHAHVVIISTCVKCNDHASQRKEAEASRRPKDYVFRWNSDLFANCIAIINCASWAEYWLPSRVGCTLHSKLSCREVASWRSFAAAMWHNKHPWIVVEPEDVHCSFCKPGAACLLSSSSMFVSVPFTGKCPDKLVQHEHSSSHQAATTSYREGQQRLALGTTTCALKIMYVLNKQEIAHMSNFKELKSLCELLGNDSLKRLKKAKNLNYESEDNEWDGKGQSLWRKGFF